MITVFDCRDEAELLAGLRHARKAIARGELIVFPTDTVYGLAADAFSPTAVQRLLDAKGRGRAQPPPVLVSGRAMLGALVEEVPDAVDSLIERFWPGGLTIVLPAQPSLSWDLGETAGTVALRMPDQRLALELIADTGPLAVSSANLTGRPAALSSMDAERMLGEKVAVYLDGGPSAHGIASTIIDATALVNRGADAIVPRVRILREGLIRREQLAEALGELLAPEGEEPAGASGQSPSPSDRTDKSGRAEPSDQTEETKP